MGVNVGGVLGKLYWALGFDTGELKKDSDKAVQIVDNMSNQINKKEVFKQMIADQKQLVAEVEADVKRMKEAYANMNAGAAKNGPNGLGADISAANKALLEEKAKLAQLQEQSKQSNDKEGSSIEGLIGKLKMWAIGIFSVHTAMQLFNGIMKATETTGVEFQAVIKGAETGIQYLFKTIASGDWSNFREGLNRAIQAGYEYIKVMDEIANESNELSIKQAEQEVHIGELREKTYNKDASNDFERKRALEEMIQIEKDIYTKKSELDKKSLDETIKLASAKTNLSDAEIRNLLHEYSSLEEVLKLGEKYNLQKALLANAQKTPGMALQANEIQKNMEQMGAGAKMAGDYAIKVGKLTLEERNQITELWVKAEEDMAAFFSKTRRYGTQLAGVDKSISDKWDAEIENANKKREELGKDQTAFQKELDQKRLDNALSIEEQMLAIQEDGKDKELKIADLKYRQKLAALDKEKKATIQKINETSGYIDDNGERVYKAVTVLPADLQKEDTAQRDAALMTRNAKWDEINKKSRADLKAINQEITKDFADEVEKHIIEINKEYDARIKKAKEAGADSEFLTDIESKRAEAISQAHESASLKMTEYYKKAFGDISTYGYASLQKLIADTDKIMGTARTEKREGKTMIIVDVDELDKEGNAVKKTVSMTIEEFKQLQEKYNSFVKAVREKNPFKAVEDSFKDLLTAVKGGSKEDIGDALGKFNKSADEAIKQVKELSSDFGTLFGKDVGDGIDMIADLAGGLKDLGVGVARIAAGDVVGGAIQAIKGLAKTVATLAKGAQQYHKDQAAWWVKSIEMANKYKNALIDIIQAQSSVMDSAFIKDQTAIINDNVKAIAEAESEFNRLYNTAPHGNRPSTLTGLMGSAADAESITTYLSNLQVQIGVTKKKFLGITMGSKPVYGSLLKEYPALIDAGGKFNSALAEQLLTLDALPQATKTALQGLVDYNKQIEESQKAIESAVESMAGFIADDLRTALVSAWDDGTDAFEAFRGSVSAGLKKIVEDMIFNAVFAEQFKQLQANMTKSFSQGGDQSVVDDLKKFYDQAPDLVKTWIDSMNKAQQEATTAGFDWATPGASQAQATGLAGAIQQDITEQTASLIAGQMNAMQINVIEQLKVFRESVVYHKLTAENTTKMVSLLTILTTRVSQDETLRAVGL